MKDEGENGIYLDKNRVIKVDITVKCYDNLYNMNKTFGYMSPIAGQTAGPNGLKFFVRGVV